MLTAAVKTAIDHTRSSFIQELDVGNAVKSLSEHFDPSEENELLSIEDEDQQISLLLDIIKDKPANVFDDFCQYLSMRGKSHLVLEMMTYANEEEDSSHGSAKEETPPPDPQTSSMQLNYELTLKQCDQLQKRTGQLEQEQERLLRRLEQYEDIDQFDRSYENGDLPDIPEKLGLIESEIIDTGADKVIWETHRVTLQRVQNLGFGIAISGGVDNPHFANGDPSIAISDVLKSGPAEDKLVINDRIVSVDGLSFDNIEHSQAISMLKDCGSSVDMVIRRKILVPNPFESQPTRINLLKKNKKDDYGILLGYKLYVKQVTGNSLAALDGSVKEGDIILRINNLDASTLSLTDARKQIEKSREKLQLTLKKPPRAPSVTNLLHKRQNSDLDYTKYAQSQTDNTFQSSREHEKLDYEKPKIGGITKSKSQDQYQTPYKVPDQQPSHYKTPQFNHSFPEGSGARLNGHAFPVGTDQRLVSFSKDGGGAGLRIAGGNSTGIFVAAVQENSPAAIEGVAEGDEIMTINGTSVKGLTREDAVLMIMNIEDRVNLVAQNRIDHFRRHLAHSGTDSGDLFYMKAHMTYDAPKGSNHLTIKDEDIFKVTDTLRGGVVGEWAVFKLNDINEEVEAGIIPSKARAEVLRNPARDSNKIERKGSFFKRKATRRAKSLGRDHWDEVVFDGDGSQEKSKHPAYERVMLKEPGYKRPVILYGGIADICREKLLRDYSDMFDSPLLEKDGSEDTKYQSGIFKLSSIQSVINNNKHCLLDVTPGAVDKLNYAQYYPIVINIRTDKKDTVKDIRSKYSKGSSKSTRKILEQCQKIEKTYPHIFTATIDLQSSSDWYRELVETITTQQMQPIWMAEQKPLDYTQDDVLFPMANRMSIAASPEPDADLSMSLHHDMDKFYGASMNRANSDPNMDSDQVPELPPPYVNHKVPVPQMYDSQSPYSQPSHHHRRERVQSESASSPYAIHTSPAINGNNQFASLDRSRNKKSSRRHHDAVNMHNGAESDGEYMIRHRSNDHYKASPHHHTHNPPPYKARPQPPVRTQSLFVKRSDSVNSPRRTEPHLQTVRTIPASENQHRRVHHTLSYDPQISANAALYGSSALENRTYEPPRTPTHKSRSELYGRSNSSSGYPVISPPSYYKPVHETSTPTRHRHQSHPTKQFQHSQSLVEDAVFHATPVVSQHNPQLNSQSANAPGFTNQLYMDSNDAQDVTQTSQVPQRSSASFENYKKAIPNKPFYKSQHSTENGSGGESASAFESYNKQPASSIEREPTPENHTVLDTVTGKFDSSGGVLSSQSTGVSIHIPPNAIPHGTQQELYFKVCQQDNSVLNVLDLNETTLSPLILCGPHGVKFQVPVELHLPNTAANLTDMNFSLKSSQDHKGDWHSVNISNMQSQYKTTGESIIVHVDQF